MTCGESPVSKVLRTMPIDLSCLCPCIEHVLETQKPLVVVHEQVADKSRTMLQLSVCCIPQLARLRRQ